MFIIVALYFEINVSSKHLFQNQSHINYVHYSSIKHELHGGMNDIMWHQGPFPLIPSSRLLLIG